LAEASGKTAGAKRCAGPKARVARGFYGESRVKSNPGWSDRFEQAALAISMIWAHVGTMGHVLYQSAAGFAAVLVVSGVAWYFWIRPDQLEKAVQDIRDAFNGGGPPQASA
jgi:hypothetical protein